MSWYVMKKIFLKILATLQTLKYFDKTNDL